MLAEILHLVSGDHYLALMMIVILSCILSRRNLQTERVNQGGFWITVAVSALLAVQDIAESYAALDPSRYALRMAATIFGYALRPLLVLGFLLVIWPAYRKRWFLWIPAALNALFYLTALFTPLTFYFDRNYMLRRGPFGLTVFAVCLLYMILVFIVLYRRFRERHPWDLRIIYLCAAGCLGAAAVDVKLGSITILSATLISTMIFYLFLRTQDADLDPLTRLWNRMVFYKDCKKYRNAVTAVASIDMNGLKRTNDELGHDAGDRALRMIGRALHSIAGRKVLPYRIGGDEFMVLFVQSTREEIDRALLAFTDEIWRVGLSVSSGLALKEDTNGTLEEMIQVSDKRMYEEKRSYYQQHDRRKRS